MTRTARAAPLDEAATAAAHAAAAAALGADDAEAVRSSAAALLALLAQLAPGQMVGQHFGVPLPLADDAFMRLCGAVADPQRAIRLQALAALGGAQRAGRAPARQGRGGPGGPGGPGWCWGCAARDTCLYRERERG
jgi:hypothetical protein